MSRFYGTLQGNRGEATRCGTKSSGVTTYAAGWRGAIRVNVYERDDVDRFSVELVPWKDSGGAPEVIAMGLLDSAAPADTTLDYLRTPFDHLRVVTGD